MLTGIIMASGQSERMGKNKLLLSYNGVPMFRHIINAASVSNIDKLIVVTSYSEIVDYCIANGIDYRYNNAPESGQGRSIKLGVAASDKDSDFMFFVADQPLLKTEIINNIIGFYLNNKDFIIIPENKNTLANPKIFPQFLREEFLSLSEDVRGSCVVEAHRGIVRRFAVEDETAFFDIDTPEDYDRLINNTI